MTYHERMTLPKAKIICVCIAVSLIWFPYKEQKRTIKKQARRNIVVEVYHDNMSSKIYNRDLTIYENYEINKKDLKDDFIKIRKPIIKVSKELKKSI